MRRLRPIRSLRALSLTAVAVAALAAAPAALADSSESSNWAGYAVHHARVTFRQVVGIWTQPRTTCTSGVPTYSSLWVGIGGYSISSKALEQIGTESDCNAAGRIVSTAWYELVPAASQTIRLIVRPGDRLRAVVAVSGRDVSLMLQNLTRHRTFRRTVRASRLDTSSAEWILEAPSVCAGGYTCQTLPLADFGSDGFAGASVISTRGIRGSITSRHWTTTKITLAQAGRHFIAGGNAQSAPPTATPSSLRRGGRAFALKYRGAPITSAPTFSAQVSAARLVH